GDLPVPTPRQSLVLTERSRQQSRGDVDDRDHTAVGHARRPDDTERADDRPIDLVRRRHDAHLLDRDEIRFATDEYLYALRMTRYIQQLQKARLLVEYVEKLAQPRHVGRK